MIAWEQQPLARLDGQVALVTGAGRGIGRAVALALGEAGAAVAVCARSQQDITRVADEIVGRDGRALAVQCDVSRRDEVDHLVSTVETTFGPIDLLVNNAGRGSPIGPLAQTDPDDWWQSMEVNVRGPLYCARAVLPSMLSRQRGRIVNISSGAGFQAWPMVSAYAVSKAALYRLSENIAAEVRGEGVSVFAVSPGLVRTALSEFGRTCGEPSVEQFFDNLFASKADVPAEAAATLVTYIASGAADTLSGRNIDVSHDLAEMITRAAEIEENDLYAMRERE